MDTERRKSQRSDVYLIVEFRPFTKTLEYSLGITRNFSPGGFSFETQKCDLKVGEIMDFKLKHPKENFTITAMGDMVWEKAAGYNRMIGIRLWVMNQQGKDILSERVSEYQGKS